MAKPKKHNHSLLLIFLIIAVFFIIFFIIVSATGTLNFTGKAASVVKTTLPIIEDTCYNGGGYCSYYCENGYRADHTLSQYCPQSSVATFCCVPK